MLNFSHDQLQGFAAEFRVAAVATELGFIVSIPSVQAMYDLVLDCDDSIMYRVQVKTAHKAVDVRSRNHGLYEPDAFDWLIAVRMSTNEMWKFDWPTKQRRSITLNGRDQWRWPLNV